MYRDLFRFLIYTKGWHDSHDMKRGTQKGHPARYDNKLRLTYSSFIQEVHLGSRLVVSTMVNLDADIVVFPIPPSHSKLSVRIKSTSS
jgi:hypothetical protein